MKFGMVVMINVPYNFVWNFLHMFRIMNVVTKLLKLYLTTSTLWEFILMDIVARNGLLNYIIYSSF